MVFMRAKAKIIPAMQIMAMEACRGQSACLGPSHCAVNTFHRQGEKWAKPQRHMNAPRLEKAACISYTKWGKSILHLCPDGSAAVVTNSSGTRCPCDSRPYIIVACAQP